jgi:scavenger receptor class B protein 1
MYIEFYLYNWSNYQEVIDSNWTKKPSFYQMGPYTYTEKHIRKDVIFNDNHTLTFKTDRLWHYAPERSSGSLDDQITTVNPILLVFYLFFIPNFCIQTTVSDCSKYGQVQASNCQNRC